MLEQPWRSWVFTFPAKLNKRKNSLSCSSMKKVWRRKERSCLLAHSSYSWDNLTEKTWIVESWKSNLKREKMPRILIEAVPGMRWVVQWLMEAMCFWSCQKKQGALLCVWRLCTLRDLLVKARGKFLNIGPAGCGKTFLWRSLDKVFKDFSHWVGVDKAECIFSMISDGHAT